MLTGIFYTLIHSYEYHVNTFNRYNTCDACTNLLHDIYTNHVTYVYHACTLYIQLKFIGLHRSYNSIDVNTNTAVNIIMQSIDSTMISQLIVSKL